MKRRIIIYLLIVIIILGGIIYLLPRKNLLSPKVKESSLQFLPENSQSQNNKPLKVENNSTIRLEKPPFLK